MRIIYGLGPVRELVRRHPERISALLVDDQKAHRDLADLLAQAQAQRIRVQRVRKEDLTSHAGADAVHQGVVAQVKDFAYADPRHLWDATGPIVVLDGVVDPHNLGACARSAYLFGAAGVVIPAHRAAPVNATASKASAGALELLHVVQAPNLVRFLEEAKEHDRWNVAIHKTPTSQPLASIKWPERVCLVLGSEGEGVRPLVAKACDFHGEIPMLGDGVGSLNVSVACGVALYEATVRRGAR